MKTSKFNMIYEEIMKETPTGWKVVKIESEEDIIKYGRPSKWEPAFRYQKYKDMGYQIYIALKDSKPTYIFEIRNDGRKKAYNIEYEEVNINDAFEIIGITEL